MLKHTAMSRVVPRNEVRCQRTKLSDPPTGEASTAVKAGCYSGEPVSKIVGGRTGLSRNTLPHTWGAETGIDLFFSATVGGVRPCRRPPPAASLSSVTRSNSAGLHAQQKSYSFRRVGVPK